MLDARVSSFRRSSGPLLVRWIPLIWLTVAGAGEARIERIELFLTDRVLIHFDTEANQTYELQVAEAVGTNAPTAVAWTNLFVAPGTPFPNHYVVVDTRTHRQRFYRLRVSVDSSR